MANGKVKWFNNAKGYGFVRPDAGGEDLFVHYSYILGEGYKSLKAGQEVTFDLKEAPKGAHAINVVLGEIEIGQAPFESNQPQAQPASYA
jgi:CspA family cold shock protein